MPVTAPDLARFKVDGQHFVMLTAYDFQVAQILDETGVPVIFIGDTLGIFCLGYDTTIPVTMDVMVHHCRAVSRAVKNALVVGDLPFGAYLVSPQQAVTNATRLVADGGVQTVKLEGPHPITIEAIVQSGIPVMGHLGLTPQSYHALGGNRVQARTEAAVERVIGDAVSLERAGACALVLEAVPTEAARRITEALTIPTIGIGAGPFCDGQVLVTTEMLGMSAGPRPRYAKLYADLRDQISRAARCFAEEVTAGTYPASEHSYNWVIRE